jgi:putative ABC transport system ATP-binding protein
MAPIIEVKSLRKVYASDGVETVAVQDISLNINKGEFVAIMGPSGSGKSTLLHILGFLDRYTSGTYRFDGKEMSEYGEEELARIRNKKMGFVFQSFNLLSRTSVFENVKLPLLYSAIPESEWDRRAMKAIQDVGLEHRASHHSSQLSGGEKQRAAIARALVCDPQVIFADEPTGNLDSKSGQLVMETIQDLNEKMGHTVILITHETYTAEHASRIIRLHDGLIEEDREVGKRRQARDSFIK